MLTLRYALELSMIIPVMIFAFIPARDFLKVKPLVLLYVSGIFAATVITAGSFLGVKHGVSAKVIIILSSAIILAAYMLVINAGAGKKLFCFFNSSMLCVMCPMYMVYINSPSELTNDSGIWLLSSGIICIMMYIVIGAIFFRTLTVKFPMLLKEETIRDIWRFMYIIPFLMTAVIYWMTPNFPAVVMTGRVRPIGFMLITLLTGGIFILCHILWRVVSRITEYAKLQQENNLLMMENKRYKEIRSYIETARALRHDFKQHISVISEFAWTGRITELKAYILGIAENAGKSYKSFCANSAVDAIASHYEGLAVSIGAEITWRLELPGTLPMKEPDYCAILGNLLENALRAVKPLPQKKRKVSVISSMLSDAMLGLSIDNEYSGAIIHGKNGLPVSLRDGHGTGLISVINTVNHYGGTMDISTEGNIFSVDIILYF